MIYVFQFGLVNLDKIYHFAVERELGQLTISNYKGIEGMNRLMQEYGISFVTTAAEFSINIDGRRTIEGYYSTFVSLRGGQRHPNF